MKHVGEVDGLRAVAVAAVVLYHAEVNGFGGGYIGVDVFFVISGYLITMLLLEEMRTQQVSLRDFFKRRILRIAPALFATLIASAILFHFLLPPPLSDELVPGMYAAVLSISNLWLYLNGDYFADNAHNPTLHTWSLSTEEQFYLAFPILLLILQWLRKERYVLVSIGTLTVFSLSAAILVTPYSQEAAFFLPFLRAWELLVGALLACSAAVEIPALIKRVASNAGLIAIGACICFYSQSTLFPGLSAMLPVLGAAAIIMGQGSSSMANRLLCMRPMQWTGKISYSVYLVHWPIVCAASLLLTLYSMKVQFLVIACSMLFGWISWRWIETPFRASASMAKPSRVFIVFFGTCCLTLLLFKEIGAASAAAWARHPEAMRYASYSKFDLSFFRTGTCFLTPKFDSVAYFRPSECLDLSGSKQNVLIMGDSHGANIVSSVSARFPNFNVLQATASGCRPTLDVTGPERCTGIINQVYRQWLPDKGKGVEYVVLAGRWERGDIDALRKSIQYLHQLGKKVILYGPTPEYLIMVPLLLAYESLLSVDLHDRFLRQERIELDRLFKHTFSSSVTYFSSVNRLCRDGRCPLTEGPVSLYLDRDHLTPIGAMKAIEGFPLPEASVAVSLDTHR